jgi:hypothetical protein
MSNFSNREKMTLKRTNFISVMENTNSFPKVTKSLSPSNLNMIHKPANWILRKVLNILRTSTLEHISKVSLVRFVDKTYQSNMSEEKQHKANPQYIKSVLPPSAV